MHIDDPRRRPGPPPAVPVPDLAALGQRLPIVRDLSAAHRDLVMAAGEPQRHRTGAHFCTDRREQDWVYYLLAGSLSATGMDGVAREYAASETGLVDCFHAPGQPCQGAVARSEVTIFRIPQATLGRYVNFASLRSVALPDVVEIGAEESADGLELALSIGVLARLLPTDIHRLLQKTEEVPVRAGELILQQGDAGDACFIVKHGVAEVDVERHGGNQYRVAMKGPGELFGEEALLAGSQRGATVRMRTDGVLIRIEQAEFERFIVPIYVSAVSRDAADAMIGAGACWLDLREPAEFQHGALPGAVNLPLVILRLRCTSLDPRVRYIVYSDDPAYSALGNFLLGMAGLEAFHLDEAIGRLEAPPAGDGAAPLEDELADTGEREAPPAPVADPAVFDLTMPDATVAVEDVVQIGMEDLREAERQRFERRLRRAVSQLRTEADARVRSAVQEIEMTYLTELENKHRQVLELKRKVALQQREIWKLHRAAAKPSPALEAADRWPPAVSPDSI